MLQVDSNRDDDRKRSDGASTVTWEKEATFPNTIAPFTAPGTVEIVKRGEVQMPQAVNLHFKQPGAIEKIGAVGPNIAEFLTKVGKWLVLRKGTCFIKH
ncbi:hypothetical protein ACOME3_006433 [Neoechinorhynchus agilis]